MSVLSTLSILLFPTNWWGSSRYFLQVEETVVMINKNLSELDNGGYEIHYDQAPAKLSNSDVKVGRKYKDRLDNNREKFFYNYSTQVTTSCSEYGK